MHLNLLYLKYGLKLEIHEILTNSWIKLELIAFAKSVAGPTAIDRLVILRMLLALLEN